MDGIGDSRVIYGNAPFITDMRLLTSLCLLNDKVILIGSTSLREQLEQNTSRDHVANSVISQTVEVLIPEGVVWFVSPSELDNHFLGRGSVRSREMPGEDTVQISIKVAKFLTQWFLGGFSSDGPTVPAVIRDMSIAAASLSSGLPIEFEKELVSLSASPSRVPEVAGFLAQRTFERLVFSELEAYHVEDILEARLKLGSELQAFRAGIRELVWLLHQRMDITAELEGLEKECDILIETKILAALSNLERAIAAHESKTVRRILKVIGGAVLEIGKSLVSPTIAESFLEAAERC